MTFTSFTNLQPYILFGVKEATIVKNGDLVRSLVLVRQPEQYHLEDRGTETASGLHESLQRLRVWAKLKALYLRVEIGH
jgi:hypothetical protein